DASITNVNIFKLLDQSDLAAWQSGLFQLGWVKKKSADIVKSEIASVTTCPTGAAKLWSPSASLAPIGKPAKKPVTKPVTKPKKTTVTPVKKPIKKPVTPPG